MWMNFCYEIEQALHFFLNQENYFRYLIFEWISMEFMFQLCVLCVLTDARHALHESVWTETLITKKKASNMFSVNCCT